MTALVADIGGTNTRVALVTEPGAPPSAVERFRNAEFDGLAAVLGRYLARAGAPRCTHAVVAVAGPVRDGAARMTNLDWTIDTAGLADATGAAQAVVLNDLVAQGHALGDVAARHLAGPPPPSRPAAQLVVGIGTGFNTAAVHELPGGGRLVTSAESGQVSLPVWDGPSAALADDLRARHGYAGVEEALSGRGVCAVNRVVAGGQAHGTAEALFAALADAPRPADAATASLLCALLGRVLADLALTHLPWGGIYLIGGLARALSAYFGTYGLWEAFCAKGRFSDFMAGFPILVVEDDFAALTGCGNFLAAGLPPKGPA